MTIADSTMKAGRRAAVGLLRGLRRGMQVVASPISHARRPSRAVSLIAFRGFGSGGRVCITGRVTEDLGGAERPVPHRKKARLLERLRDARRLLLSREIPEARLKIAFAGEQWQSVTDANGFFFDCRDLESLPEEPMWQTYEIALAGAPESVDTPRGTQGQILVMPPTACRIIISDIDDTVVYTGVANKLIMLWRLFATGPHGRSPFPGIAALYRALHAGLDGGERNPILYVSRSPWSLYPILEEVFQLHRIPVGPVLLLRDWGVTYRHPLPRRAPEHKCRLIEDILAVERDAPVLLIGDSGQRDPEIYLDVARRHPGRIAAIYIRDLEPGEERSRELREIAVGLAEVGTEMILAPDSLGMAADAQRRGWITSGHLADVRRDAEQGTGPVDRAPPRR